MPLFVCLVRLGILLYHLFICWFVGSFVHFFVCLFLFILHLFVCYLGDISCDDIEIGDPPLQLIVSLLFFCFVFAIFCLFILFVTLATSPVITLRLVIPLSLACSSMYSLCWFELDKAFTLLPGNLEDKKEHQSTNILKKRFTYNSIHPT